MSVRRLLLLAHRVPVDGAFTLNDLAGGGGRMDEVARVVSTAFTVSNGLRRDVELTILFVAQPPPRARRILLRGDRLRYLNPDERSTAALLKNALVRSARTDDTVVASPGLEVGPVDPLPALARFVGEPDAVWLSEDGISLRTFSTSGSEFAAVLSDDQNPSVEEQEALIRARVPRVSVGPQALRASQCVDILWNELDLRAANSVARGAEPFD